MEKPGRKSFFFFDYYYCVCMTLLTSHPYPQFLYNSTNTSAQHINFFPVIGTRTMVLFYCRYYYPRNIFGKPFSHINIKKPIFSFFFPFFPFVFICLEFFFHMLNSLQIANFVRGNNLVLAINSAAGLSIFFFGVSYTCLNFINTIYLGKLLYFITIIQ